MLITFHDNAGTPVRSSMKKLCIGKIADNGLNLF
jgi:hypothetical protein